MIISFWVFTALPLLIKHAIFIWCVWCIITTVCFLVLDGTSKIFFSISYILNRRNRVLNPYFLISTCPMSNAFLCIIRGPNQLPFYKEKILFSLKLSSAYFYGQSCIKTVWGPLHFKLLKLIFISITFWKLVISRYEVYRGYIVFVVCVFVNFFLSKISQQLLELGFWNLVQSLIVMSCIVLQKQPHIAYQSLYLFIFLSPMEFSVTDFSAPIGASVLKFSVHF